MTEKYWFFIDSTCEIKIKKDAALIYNPLNGRILEYCRVPEIIKIIRRLKTLKNMGVIPLTAEDLKKPAVAHFVNRIRKNYMGDLIGISYSGKKPIQLTPKIIVMEGVSYKKGTRKPIFSGERALDNVTRAVLFLTDRCGYGCPVCKGANTQFLWCRSGNDSFREIELSRVQSIFRQLHENKTMTIDILGGNLFSYSRMPEFLDILRVHPAKKTFHFHYLQAYDNLLRWIQWAKEGFSFAISVHFPINEEKFTKVATSAHMIAAPVSFRFLVESEEDFNSAEKHIATHNIGTAEFLPFFNGKNIGMFKKNLYLNKKDISAAKQSMKTIYANKLINSLSFGKLFILPDGKVKANVLDPDLGSIDDEPLAALVHTELTIGKSWRKTRRKVVPCKHCLYVDLCPPLSNYNRVIGRNDLCHMTADLKRSLGAKKR